MVDPQSFDASFAVEYDFMATLTRDHAFFLERLPARRRRALDVGCGSGGLVECLAPCFEHVHGVDISEPLLEIARAKRALPNVSYGYGDADTFAGIEPAGPDADTDGYDLIVSHTMCHHLKQPPTSVRRLASMLAPGGRLLVVDNISWTDAIPRPVFWIGPFRGLPGWIRRFGAKDALRLFRFSLSKRWVDHLCSDRLMTETGFRHAYGGVLPDAVFTKFHVFMGIEWTREPVDP